MVLKIRNITKSAKKTQRSLVNSKKCSTFAAAFEKKAHGGIAQLVRAHDS